VKALRKGKAEAVEQGGLRGLGAHNAANVQLTARLFGQRQDHVGALDAAQLVEDGARTVAQAGASLPLLQGLPQDIGQEAFTNATFPFVLSGIKSKAAGAPGLYRCAARSADAWLAPWPGVVWSGTASSCPPHRACHLASLDSAASPTACQPAAEVSSGINCRSPARVVPIR
jgi:hypothetical protein